MQSNLFKSLILSFALTGGVASVQASSDLDRLTELNKDGEFAKAYQLALEQRPQMEGLPEFDMQYGIAAVDSGHPNEGIFAFERVLMAQPGYQAARLELARAYYLIGEFDRSERLFNDVLALNPPGDVKARVDVFLSRIEEAKRGPVAVTRRSVSFRVGYDDNVNSGPGDASSLALYDAFGNLYEASGVSSQGDRFSRLTGSLMHQNPINDNWSWLADVSADGRWYEDLNSLDNLSLDVGTGVIWQGDGQFVRTRVSGQRYILDHHTYRNLYGVSVEYQKALGRDLAMGVFGSWNRLEYGAGTRDADMTLAGVSARWRADFIGDPLLQASLYTGRETPRDDNLFTAGSAERDITGGHLGASWMLSTELTLNTALIFQNSRYDGPYYLLTPLTSADRNDRNTAFLADLQWQLSPRIKAFTELSLRDNDSNTALLDYQRQQVALGVHYQF
ncbi:porin family protein [Marinobacterium lacunae]|uniref:porin family protein n=1 Tax=Marinobacterium lacunae TaxID=1232683 RepID=UPI0018CC0FD9|nr:porin family protein [Marinobacterium lacunae]